jgi:arsenite methyltransferase
MVEVLTPDQRAVIAKSLREKYSRVAVTPEGNFRYPTGRAGLDGLKYDPRFVDRLPADVQDSYCGVGNPFQLGPVSEGDLVLDVGCGCGVDTLIAGMMVGVQGRVTGIDFIPEMLECARENLRKTGLGNVKFQKASAEDIPLQGDSFNVVISNGVFNLIPDKPGAARELFRMLRPGGRLMLADQVLIGEPPADTTAMVDTWAG